MSFVTIAAKIKEMLAALTDDDGNPLFSVVFDYPVSIDSLKVKDFPIAVMLETGNESDYLTNRENFRTYIYEIHVVKVKKNADDRKEWQEMRKIADKLIDTFDDDWMLQNTVVNVKPVPATFGVDKTQGNAGTWFTCVVLLRCELDHENALPE